MSRIRFHNTTALRRWFALLSIAAPLTATGQLRLVCEIDGSIHPLAAVEDDQLMVAKDGQSFRAPGDATWRLEGDIRQHAEYFRWAPWYSITRTIEGELAAAPEKPFKSTLLLSNPFNQNEEQDADALSKDWPDELPTGGAAVVAWLVDGKVTDLNVVALQATGKGSLSDFGAQFRLDADAVRGQPALLLWGEGSFMAPIPLFEDPNLRQALVAALFDDREALARTTAMQNPDALSREKKPLINYVAEAGAPNALALLLEQDRRTARASDDDGVTPLHLAASKGREHAVDLLLQAGAVVNAMTKAGETPLSEAVGGGFLPVASLLLEARALPSNRTHRSSLLKQAISRGFVDLAKLLTDAGAKFDFSSDEAATTLIERARDGHLAIVQWLAENGVNANEARAGQTAIQAAARNGSRELAEALIAAGADPNKSNITGFSPLMAAAENGNTAFASVLLAAGADANAQLESGVTVLQIAAHKNATEIVRLLMDAGADIEVRNHQGLSALDAALLTGAGDAARELASRGASLDLGSSISQRLLETALLWDIPEPLEAAIEAGWPPTSTFAGVWPALRLAQLFGATRCETVLTTAGATTEPEQPMPVISAGELDERLKITRAVLPTDPRPPTESFSDAVVRVEFLVDSEGRPLFPRLLETPDQRLGPSALEVIGQWRFTPPRREGQAVATHVVLPISFPGQTERIFDFEELSEPPRPVFRSPPTYPFALKANQIEGSVALLFVIGTDGNVRDVKVESSSDPRFSEAAIDAVYHWRFTPGRFAGRPVATRARQIIGFRSRPN